MKKKHIIPVAILGSIALMSSVIDLNDLIDYESQVVPSYINKDNTPNDNAITNIQTTIGRVLFYDKNLSADNSTSCATCHLQEFAFGDTSVVSTGVNGGTGRHSMRLVNAQFSNESHFFWDERASTLEEQTTQPIQDHVEMGFSGANGDPDIDSLVSKLEKLEYYNYLFNHAYGNTEIAEYKIQYALAQFVRSIHSFDSKYDTGRAVTPNIINPFPNFTALENQGKNLFLAMPPFGGAGCARCHQGDEFSIVSDSKNNGVIGVASGTGVDLTNTKAPSLRDLVNKDGKLNGPFMHDGSLKTLMDVVDHYNDLIEMPINTNLDFRLAGPMHDLNLDSTEKEAIVAFLMTLTGNDIYTNKKWSDPFDSTGNLTVIPFLVDGIEKQNELSFHLYPNVTSDNVNIRISNGEYKLSIFTNDGRLISTSTIYGNHTLNINSYTNGVYLFNIQDIKTSRVMTKKVIKK